MRAPNSITIPLFAFVASVTGSYNNTTRSCNSSLASVNAFGTFTFAVEYPIDMASTAEGQSIQMVPDPSWLMTVDRGDSVWDTSFWYDTAGQNYSNDLSINYDACAFIITHLPINTVELGQDDPGDCSSTLSQGCRAALMDRIASSAEMWTTYSSPPPYSNLSAGVLPTLCSYILGGLSDGNDHRYPIECANEFGFVKDEGEVVVENSLALTGYNSSIMDNSCVLQSGNKSFYHVTGWGGGTEAEGYDNLTRSIYPTLTVYFSVANVDRTSFYSGANSTLRCLRVRDFNQGSEVSPTLPSGKPYRNGKSLAKGTVAGIVVGAIVGVALIVGSGIWFFLHRRRARARAADAAQGEGAGGSGTVEMMPEADGAAFHEMSPEDRKPEIDGAHIAELDHAEKPAELENDGQLVELSAVAEGR